MSKRAAKPARKAKPVFCGLGPVPKGRRRPFMQPCAEKGSISYYGYQQLPEKYLKLVPKFKGTPAPSAVGRAPRKAPAVRKAPVRKPVAKRSGSKTPARKATVRKAPVRVAPASNWLQTVAMTRAAIFEHNECYATQKNAMIVASALRNGEYQSVPSAVMGLVRSGRIEPMADILCNEVSGLRRKAVRKKTPAKKKV